MAKFKYIAVTKDAPAVTTVYGVKFQAKGEAVEVADEKAAAKLRGNPDFEEVGTAEAKAKGAKAA
jgi:hypothetical protein